MAQIIKIPVQYIEHKSYIFVRTIIPEKPHGAKALKNEDFKDHDYWPTAYAYSKQVTERLINDKYEKWQEELSEKSTREEERIQQVIAHEKAVYGYSPTLEKSQAQSRVHNYFISYELTERMDQYKLQISYKNYEKQDMFVELCFYGPLSYPKIANHTLDQFIALNCVIPKQHYIVVDMYSQEVVGNSNLGYISGSTFWSLTPGPNELEFSAENDIGNGNVRVQTRYEMKT